MLFTQDNIVCYKLNSSGNPEAIAFAYFDSEKGTSLFLNGKKPTDIVWAASIHRKDGVVFRVSNWYNEWHRVEYKVD